MSIRDTVIRPHLDLLHSLQDVVAENLTFLAQPDKAWQPTDYLPDLTREDYQEQLRAFREPAKNLSDEILVVLVGDMVTEEALPSYSVSLNEIAQDPFGDSPIPWAKWLRGWTAEENRHGDLLNAYLRLTGRVDMRSIELTIHHLLNNGFNPKTFPDPYNGLIYTSFQERATKVSHGNVGKIAAKEGDAALGRICARIAGDESRHETFYTRMMGHVFDKDPEGSLLACRDMFRSLIKMPAKLMYDGKDPDLFDHFATVAQRTGVYTVYDYASILDHLLKTWRVAERPAAGQAAKAQEWLCRQPERYIRHAEEIAESIKLQPPTAFSWIHDRKV